MQQIKVENSVAVWVHDSPRYGDKDDQDDEINDARILTDRLEGYIFIVVCLKHLLYHVEIIS